MSPRRRCFLAAPFGAATEVLAREIQQRGYEIQDGRTLALAGSSVMDSVRSAVRNASLFCAVLPSRPSPSAYFELGLAVALSKSIVIFAEMGVDLPSDLAGITYCRASLADGPEIGRFLDVFLRHHSGKATRPTTATKHARARHTLTPPQARRVQQRLASAHGLEIETLLRDVFAMAGYVVSTPYEGPSESVDFAVWIDALQTMVGNPVPVEVKAAVVSSSALDVAEAQLRKHLEQVGTKLGLLIYTARGGKEFSVASSGWPLVVRLPASRIVTSLAAGSFEREIIHIRNRAAHGLPPA